MSGLVSGIVSDVRQPPCALRLDDTVSSTIYYCAQAVAGALTSAAVWQIQRITFTTPGEDDTTVEWADGDIKFDNVWDDRLTLSYS